MPQDQFQLSPASVEARFRILEWRRLWNPRADDPLFRPIDADDFRINGVQAHDFSNLRENGLIRVAMPLPSNVRLIDPLTGQPSAETSVDVWRSVPTVNDVKLTGPDGINLVAARAEPRRRIPARCPRRHAAGAGARRAAQSCPDPERRRRSACSTTSPRSSALLFTNLARAQSLRCHQRRRHAAAGSGSAHSMRSSCRARQSSRAPARNATAGPTSPPHQAPLPIVRYHDIATACPRPVDSRDPGALQLQALPAAAGAQRAHVPDHAAGWHHRLVAPVPIRAARC